MSESPPYQVMPDLDEEEYHRLKDDIEDHGVEYPIIKDADGNIIDGHHRAKACEELGIDPPVRVVDDTEEANYHRAYRTNLNRRDLTDGTKRKAVKQYLLEHPERLDEDTQEEIAKDLGVSDDTVKRAREDLDDEGVEIFAGANLNTSEKKQKVRAHLNQHPDASSREVAREVGFDITHVTVSKWRNEWEDTREQPSGLDAFATSEKDEEKAQSVAKKAREGDDTAQKEAEKVSKGEKSPHTAWKEVKRSSREKEREENEEKVNQPTIPESSPTPDIRAGDATDLELPDGSVDIIITSPPYNLGHERWPMGGEGRDQRDDGIGYDDALPEGKYQRWQLDVFNELYRVASEGASFFYNHKVRQKDGGVIHPTEWVCSDDNPWTLRQEIVWDRKSTHNHTPTLFYPQDERVYWLTKGDPDTPEEGIGMPSVWRFHGPKPDTDHPAPFPPGLPKRCLEAVGSGDQLVLDPFAGSFTTCEVAAKLGYESVGVDINPDYVERAKEVILGGD